MVGAVKTASIRQGPLEAEGASQQLAVPDVRKEKGIQSRSMLNLHMGKQKPMEEMALLLAFLGVQKPRNWTFPASNTWIGVARRASIEPHSHGETPCLTKALEFV